jgi:hypothetical protein
VAHLVCFYTKLDPRAEAALKLFAPDVGLEIEWVETPDPGMSYANELEARWTGEDDLILIEQDKEIFSNTLPSLMTCSNLWCTATYWLFPEPHTTLCIGGFGATKFSAQIQRDVKVSEFAGDRQQGIDRRFIDLLLTKSIPACLHSMVTHHHVYEPRPAGTRAYVNNLREQHLLPPAMAPLSLGPHLLPGSYDL